MSQKPAKQALGVCHRGSWRWGLGWEQGAPSLQSGIQPWMSWQRCWGREGSPGRRNSVCRDKPTVAERVNIPEAERKPVRPGGHRLGWVRLLDWVLRAKGGREILQARDRFGLCSASAGPCRLLIFRPCPRLTAVLLSKNNCRQFPRTWGTLLKSISLSLVLMYRVENRFKMTPKEPSQ